MKPYIKPELFYERYEVSQHLADCAWEFQYGDENTCRATADPNILGTVGNPVLFMSAATLCDPVEVQEFFHYCYQNGSAFEILFMS